LLKAKADSARVLGLVKLHLKQNFEAGPEFTWDHWPEIFAPIKLKLLGFFFLKFNYTQRKFKKNFFTVSPPFWPQILFFFLGWPGKFF